MKLLVFRSREPLQWESCKAISCGLRAAYERLGPAFQIAWQDLTPDHFVNQDPRILDDLAQVARYIEKESPDRLVFMDQMPLPPAVLLRLRGFIDFEKLPPIVIHVYGDFTYFAKQWHNFLSHAHALRLHFVVASASQKRLLRYFLGDQVKIDVCHFPVSEDMAFSTDLREKIRQDLEISADERVLIYTGRVHIQKNVDTLIQTFADHCLKYPSQTWRLWIVGALDDLGGTSLGIATPEGYIYKKIEKAIQTLPGRDLSRVKFWGWADKQRMRELLAAADLFVSMSLYHDEDFGMSPAEALVSGLRCLLTDWGGYSSFVSADQHWDCQLLPVAFSDFGHKIDCEKLKIALLEEQSELSKRAERGQEFFKAFCAEAAAKILAKRLLETPKPFNELAWRMSLFVRNVDYDGSKALNDIFFPSANSYYAEVYSNYVSRLHEVPRE